MPNWTLRTLIVPDQVTPMARMACETLAGAGGSSMFTTPVSPTGEEPTTHWISSGLIEQDFADLLPTKAYNPATDVWEVIPHDTTTLQGLCEAVSLPYQAVDQVLSLVDVSEQTAEEALGRLGLKLVTIP